MPLVGTKEMFKKAYEGGYAIGAFNVNNMEIVQGITEAAAELNSPVILQASAGARKYAKGPYLRHLVLAALEVNDIPVALHLDHGPDFETCKACIDDGFTSVMYDGSVLSFDENMAMERQFHYEPLNDILFYEQSEIIREAAKKEDCVIVGRCANYILRENPQCRSVFIYAPLEARIRTIRARTGLDARGAEQLIKRVDKQRKYYYENYTEQKWGRKEGFDLGIDSSRFTDEQILEILSALYRTIE